MINIVYSSDSKFAWIMAVSLFSLLENNLEEEFNVFILDFEIAPEDKKRIENMCASPRYKSILNFVNVECIKSSLSHVEISKLWGIASFGRLFLTELLPTNIKKILYLDCDTIISGSIKDMYNFDYSNYAIAGVKDCVNKYFAKTIGFKPIFPYFNAGVMIFNLNFLRENQYFKVFFDKIVNSKISLCPDQDIINICVKNCEKFVLALEYNFLTSVAFCNYEELLILRHPFNFYTKEEIINAKKRPIIMHFCSWDFGGSRPWNKNSNHPYKYLFLEYLNKSPFNDHELINNKSSLLHRLVVKIPKVSRYRIVFVKHNFGFFCWKVKKICFKSINHQ